MNQDVYTLRTLSAYGFSPEDITHLMRQGWRVEQIAGECRRLMDTGLTSGEYVRQTFQEVYPELFGAVPVYSATKAADFGEDVTKFVWYPYIPERDYTVLMAPGGTGKTYFVCGVAAALSTGRALPGEDARKPSNVLIISAEDRGETLKKRLRASGADLERVFLLDCRDSVGLNFTDKMDLFQATVRQYNPSLVVVDPWHAFLGTTVDINRVNAVRPCFQKLANIARECSCGMILVSHVNKRSQGDNVNFAATGSTDFVNAARSALYCITDDEDPDGRIIVHTKTNYAATGQSVKFRINENGGLDWNGFSDIDRNTMEQAARQRKTAGEVIREEQEQEKINVALIKALMDAANPNDTVRFTYQGFKEKYGFGIFGSMQPKKALDAAVDAMYARGYELDTGIMVKAGGYPGKGFAIHSLAA